MDTLWSIGKILLFIGGLILPLYVYYLYMKLMDTIPNPKDKDNGDEKYISY
ncbi:hypothetical protein [Paenibacillus sp. CMAA1364]